MKKYKSAIGYALLAIFLTAALFFSFTHDKRVISDFEFSRANYTKSSPTGLSLEDIVYRNYNNLTSLKNFYDSKADKLISTKYSNIYNTLLQKASKQNLEMSLLNLESDNLRITNSDLNKLYEKSVKEKILLNRDQILKKYQISDDEYSDMNQLINVTLNDLPDELRKVATRMKYYFALGKNINYTYLEYFEDATGYNSLPSFFTNVISDKRVVGIRMENESRGLSLESAINRLEGLNNKSEAITSITASPNPFIDKLVINFFHIKSENVQLQISDIQGRIVLNENKFFEPGQCSFEYNNLDLGTGIYIYSLSTSGKKFGGKIFKK